MILKLWKLLNEIKRQDYLPKLKEYAVEFNPRHLDENTRIVLEAGWARDPDGARRWLEQHGVESAYDAPLHRHKPRPERRRRFKNWLMRLFGETPTDRVMAEYWQWKRQQDTGIYEANLTWRKSYHERSGLKRRRDRKI